MAFHLRAIRMFAGRKQYLAMLLALLASIHVLGADKPVPQPKDYGQWEGLARFLALSPNGEWLAYGVNRVSRENELRVRAIEGDQELVFPFGARPAFSADSQWLMWTIQLSEEEREKLQKDKKPVRTGIALLKVGEEEEQSFEETSSAAFDEDGRYLALLGYAPKEPKGKGADLRLLDLAKGTETTFGNVASFKWNEKGSLLAMLIMTGTDRGNGIQVYDAEAGRLHGLDTSESAYKSAAWREDSADLVVYRSVEKASEKETTYSILAWQGVDSDEPKRMELTEKHKDIEGFEISADGVLGWSESGGMISLGLKPKDKEEEAETGEEDEEKKKTEKKEEEKGKSAGVQIWHSNDVDLFPAQKARKDRNDKRTLLTVWHLDADKLVRVGSEIDENSELIEGWRFGLERFESPYAWGHKFGRPYEDIYLVDTSTGERRKALEKVRYSWTSANGAYLMHYDGKDYHTIDVTTGKKTNITANLDAVFTNMEYDTPTDQRPPYGVGGWLTDDAAVLLYDRFDVWRVAPDGSGGTRLTQGAKDEVIHRLVDLDREEEAYDTNAPLYFGTRGEWTEKRGYARLNPGKKRTRQLMEVDAWPSYLTKAKDADTFVYMMEARDDSPDFFTAGPDLKRPRQLSETNPFHDDFAWTRSELVNFDSESGRPLQAVLLYPANHDPSKRYPMIVYTYEQLSWLAHRYELPDERRMYNHISWALNGYFVLLPDIIYTPREPGVSAIEAVRPAVAKVVSMGLVDEKKVGLIGHSWGGYQAAYMPTRTNIFAASISGAPLTDFVSFMGQIHWNPGVAEVDHWETGQARMEVPYWEDPEAHERNSPIHKVHEMETPMLMVHGNKDGVVEFFQATIFFNFARRAGKEMVLLVYEDEDHGFRKKENVIDYHRRILEWFGHYLKDEPAPQWIAEGVKLKDLDEEKKRIAEKFPTEEEEPEEESEESEPESEKN